MIALEILLKNIHHRHQLEVNFVFLANILKRLG